LELRWREGAFVRSATLIEGGDEVAGCCRRRWKKKRTRRSGKAGVGAAAGSVEKPGLGFFCIFFYVVKIAPPLKTSVAWYL